MQKFELHPFRRNFSPVDVSQDPMLRGSVGEKSFLSTFGIEGKYFMCSPLKDDETASFHEIFLSPNASEWMATTKDEISSISSLGVNTVWCQSIENKCFKDQI